MYNTVLSHFHLANLLTINSHILLGGGQLFTGGGGGGPPGPLAGYVPAIVNVQFNLLI